MLQKVKVLVVDDELGIRKAIRMLLKDKYEVILAVDGRDGIAKHAEERPDVVLLDLRMPDMSGVDVLQAIKTVDPNVEVILVTAYATIDTARKALRLGAFDYITKPFNPHELEEIVQRAYERREETLRSSADLEAIQQNYQSLCKEVELAKYQIATQVHDSIYALLMSLELRDAYSGQHSMAVLWLVDHFSEFLGVGREDRLRIKRAALVHDIGKIGIPEEILNRPEPLRARERKIMEQHPVLSSEIIASVNGLADVVPIVLSHHERWDGNGYPSGLKGDQIPWQVQILSICDTVHAMGSKRCYRPMMPEAAIRRELQLQRDKQFKGEYVDAMLASPLISEIFQAEQAGSTVLTLQQIRHVLDESVDTNMAIIES